VIGRLARRISGDFRPAHARVMTILILALGAILPWFLLFFDEFRQAPDQRPQFWITDPFSTLVRLGSEHADSSLLILLLVSGAVIAVTINLRGMIAGIIDVARPHTPHAPAPPRPAAVKQKTAPASDVP
jgi:hypothetical protein